MKTPRFVKEYANYLKSSYPVKDKEREERIDRILLGCERGFISVVAAMKCLSEI